MKSILKAIIVVILTVGAVSAQTGPAKTYNLRFDVKDPQFKLSESSWNVADWHFNCWLNDETVWKNPSLTGLKATVRYSTNSLASGTTIAAMFSITNHTLGTFTNLATDGTLQTGTCIKVHVAASNLAAVCQNGYAAVLLESSDATATPYSYSRGSITIVKSPEVNAGVAALPYASLDWARIGPYSNTATNGPIVFSITNGFSYVTNVWGQVFPIVTGTNVVGSVVWASITGDPLDNVALGGWLNNLTAWNAATSNDVTANLVVTSNGLAAAAVVTSNGLSAADGIVSNALSARLVLTNSALEAKLVATNAAILALAVLTNQTSVGIGDGVGKDNYTFAQGGSITVESYTLAQGYSITAKSYALAQGGVVTAGDWTLAQGLNVTAGNDSLAQGDAVTAGNGSVAQGSVVTNGDFSFAVGRNLCITNNEFMWGDNLGGTIPNHGEYTATFGVTNMYLFTKRVLTTDDSVGVHRYLAFDDTGFEIMVTASASGITATTVGSTVTFHVPAGVVMLKAKIRIPSGITAPITLAGLPGTSDIDRTTVSVAVYYDAAGTTGAQITTAAGQEVVANVNQWKVLGHDATKAVVICAEFQ